MKNLLIVLCAVFAVVLMIQQTDADIPLDKLTPYCDKAASDCSSNPGDTFNVKCPSECGAKAGTINCDQATQFCQGLKDSGQTSFECPKHCAA
ncbi:hypothetical protein PGB90_009569 [Kerria lacca]